MEGRMMRSLVPLALVGALATWVGAEVRHDTFQVELQGQNQLVGGSGSGWNNAEWIYYPDTDWWNQWFYNDPPDPRRWKEISYDIVVELDDPPMDPDEFMRGGVVYIALNWSTEDFPETGPGGPPPDPSQEQYVARREIFYHEFLPGPPESYIQTVQGDFLIPDYNPEWVSIDVRVDAWRSIELVQEPNWLYIPLSVSVEGEIWHECVPEPATLSLVALGGLAVIRRRRRR